MKHDSLLPSISNTHLLNIGVKSYSLWPFTLVYRLSSRSVSVIHFEDRLFSSLRTVQFRSLHGPFICIPTQRSTDRLILTWLQKQIKTDLSTSESVRKGKPDDIKTLTCCFFPYCPVQLGFIQSVSVCTIYFIALKTSHFISFYMDRNSGLFRIAVKSINRISVKNDARRFRFIVQKLPQKLNSEQISLKLKIFRPKMLKNYEFFHY